MKSPTKPKKRPAKQSAKESLKALIIGDTLDTRAIADLLDSLAPLGFNLNMACVVRPGKKKTPKEVLDKYREAQRWSVEKPMTAKEILEGYVERERRELEDGKSAHRFATKRCEDYEKAHPVKVRLGSKEFKELVAIENRMKANVERLQKALDEKLANPKVQRDAEIEAKQRDMKIREGVAFEKAVQPHVKGLRMTLHKEWEKQRKHDRELQKQRGHGHDPWSRGL